MNGPQGIFKREYWQPYVPLMIVAHIGGRRSAWFTVKAVDDKVIRDRDRRPPHVALVVGWGVRSVHAPENRYVVGLRGSTS